MSSKRNVAEYEGSIEIDEQLLDDMVQAANAVTKALDAVIARG